MKIFVSCYICGLVLFLGSGSSSMSSLYDMICGVGKSSTIQDSTGVSSVSAQAQPSSLSAAQEAEKRTMPSKSQANLFKIRSFSPLP